MNRLAVGIGNEFNSPWGRSQGFGGLVSVIVSNAIFIAAIILLFMVVGGGIMMISSAGSNDPQSAAKGKQAATAGFIGFIIIFASFWLIRVIEAVTGLNILESPL